MDTPRNNKPQNDYILTQDQPTVPHNQVPQQQHENFQEDNDLPLPPLPLVLQVLAGANNHVMYTPEGQMAHHPQDLLQMTPDNQRAVLPNGQFENEQQLEAFWLQLYQELENFDFQEGQNQPEGDEEQDVAVPNLVAQENWVYHTPQQQHGQNPLNFWQQPQNEPEQVAQYVAPEDWGYETP